MCRYTGEGMDVMEFSEAESNAQDLMYVVDTHFLNFTDGFVAARSISRCVPLLSHPLHIIEYFFEQYQEAGARDDEDEFYEEEAASED
jgi:hypothetical protein